MNFSFRSIQRGPRGAGHILVTVGEYRLASDSVDNDADARLRDTSAAGGSLKASGIEVPAKAARMRSMQSTNSRKRKALAMLAAVTAREMREAKPLD